MSTTKRIISVLLLIIMLFTLCGCGESDSARSKRLEREAAEANQKAKEAMDNYRQLKDFYDKYGNN